ARLAEGGITMNQSGHGAVLEPELVFVIPVPVNLGVDVVAVQPLSGGLEVVADIPRLVGGRDQIQQLHHGSVEPGSGNNVEPSTAGKYRAACAVHVACEGIEHHSFPEWHRAPLRGGHRNGVALGIQNLRPQHSAEIPRAEVIRRDRKEPAGADPLEGAFPVSEKEKLVLYDRSADAAPVDISDASRLFLYPGAILIPQEGPQGAIVVQAEGAAVELV